MKIKVKVGNVVIIERETVKKGYIVIGFYQNEILLLEESKLSEKLTTVIDVVKFIYQEDVSYRIEEYEKIDSLLLKLKLMKIHLNIVNMNTVTYLDVEDLDIDKRERTYYTWHELNDESIFYHGNCKILSLSDNILEIKLGKFKRPLAMPIQKSAWYSQEE